MKQSKIILSESLFLYLVAGLVIILLVALSATRIRQYDQTVKHISVETRAMEAKQNRLESLKALQKTGEQLVTAFDHLEGKIPKLPAEQALIAQINRQAAESGTGLVQLRLDDRVSKEKITELPMTLVLEGNYSSLLNMLKSLSEGERLIRIDGVKITREDLKPGIVRADILASAFCDDSRN